MQNIRRNPRKTNGVTSFNHPPLDTVYIGRFAPSPTGPLHLGSLYTALASFLQARSNQGKWLVRIDDLDEPRNSPGATDQILDTLENFGLHWDDEVLFQSRKREAYFTALAELEKNGLLYACTCTRKILADYHSKFPNGPEYPGTCRNNSSRMDGRHALRVKTDDFPIAFNDSLQGQLQYNLLRDHGDFIVKRRDDIIAYQLSIVVDDFDQKISEVVRGFDLLDSTPKQIFLQNKLGYVSPTYMHVPIIIDKHGAKLSKQTHADPVDPAQASKQIYHLLVMLKQSPPVELQNAPVDEQLSWAITAWNPNPLKKYRAISL